MSTYSHNNQLSHENSWLLRVQKHEDATPATMLVNTVVENEKRQWPDSRSLGEKVSSKNCVKRETYNKKCLPELVTNFKRHWWFYTVSEVAATQQKFCSTCLPSIQAFPPEADVTVHAVTILPPTHTSLCDTVEQAGNALTLICDPLGGKAA